MTMMESPLICNTDEELVVLLLAKKKVRNGLKTITKKN